MKSQLIIFFLLVAGFSYAQPNPTEGPDLPLPKSKKAPMALKVPELEALIDSALKRSPLIQGQQSLINIQEEEISMIKKDWMRHLSLKTGVAYGTGGVNLSQASDALTNIVSTNQTYRYDAGVYLSVSPSDLLTRKNRLRKEQNRLNYELQKKAELEEDLRLFITAKYQDFHLKFDLFQVYNKLKENSDASMIAAEIDFKNGNLSLNSYNDLLLKNAKANAEFETSKNDLLNSKRELEIVTGIPITLGPKQTLEPIF